MKASLQSRQGLLLCGIVVIVTTSLYLVYAVGPIYLRPAGEQLASAGAYTRPDSLDRSVPGPAANQAYSAAGGWSTVAMACLGLPFAVCLAFSAASRRQRLPGAERVAWLLISLISLTLFFVTASATNTLFEQLLG